VTVRASRTYASRSSLLPSVPRARRRRQNHPHRPRQFGASSTPGSQKPQLPPAGAARSRCLPSITNPARGVQRHSCGQRNRQWGDLIHGITPAINFHPGGEPHPPPPRRATKNFHVEGCKLRRSQRDKRVQTPRFHARTDVGERPSTSPSPSPRLHATDRQNLVSAGRGVSTGRKPIRGQRARRRRRLPARTCSHGCSGGGSWAVQSSSAGEPRRARTCNRVKKLLARTGTLTRQACSGIVGYELRGTST